MSNSEEQGSKDSEVNVPPIKLPDPDPFDTSKSNEGSNSIQKRKKKQQKKKKKGRHPLDQYQDVRREKKGFGCCGGIGCLALVLILIVLGAGVYGSYYLFGDLKDYKIVQLEGVEETISDAPTEPTLFVGKGTVIYNVPITTVPLAVAGNVVEVSGEFEDKLSLRGAKVTCRVGTHCKGDLNVFAVEFIDEGAVVDGAKSGKTLQ